MGGGSLPLIAALACCHPGPWSEAIGDRVQAKSSITPSLQHYPQILNALGISGIESAPCSWIYTGKDAHNSTF